MSNDLRCSTIIENWEVTFNKSLDAIEMLEDSSAQENIVDELLRVRKCSPGSANYTNLKELGVMGGFITGDGPDNADMKLQVFRYVIVVSQDIHFITKQRDANGFSLMLTKLEIAVICLLHNEMRIGENMLTKMCREIKKIWPGNSGDRRIELIQQSINTMLQRDNDFMKLCADAPKMLNTATLKEELDSRDYTSTWRINVEGQRVDPIRISCARLKKIFAHIDAILDIGYLPDPGVPLPPGAEETKGKYKELSVKFSDIMQRLNYRGTYFFLNGFNSLT